METSEKKFFHLAVGIPSSDHWMANFAICVLQLIGDLKAKPLPGYDDTKISILNIKSSILPKSREDIVDEAVKMGCDALIWVDSDQVFPSDIVRQLWARDKDIIGCNIAMKMTPSLPTARKHSKKHPEIGDIVYTEESNKGIEKVWRLGFGVMLIKLHVFSKIEKPFFDMTWTKERGYKGEDWSFCEKVEAAGLEIWVDHAASWDTYHLGLHGFCHKDIDPTEKNIKIVRLGEPGDAV